jgi:glycosyltransferase involved in cell wall biosynthesis
MSPNLIHITTVPMSLTFFRGQIAFMKERGYHVHAVSSPGPDLDAFAQREGVEVSAVPMSRRITPVADFLAILGLIRVFLRIRPTIVHAHTPKGGLLGTIAATLYGAKVRIYHIRGLPMMGATGLRRRLLQLSERVACRLAHRVFCVSHSVRDEVVRAGLCPPEKIVVLCGGSGNGVDSEGRFNPDRLPDSTRSEVRDRFGIASDDTVIGFVGRIVRDKGVVELARAWMELRDRSDLHLLMVGPFEEEDPIPGEIERLLRSDPRVHLAGMDWNTPLLYAAMDIVVLPTYREGFPNVPLEAAAMGLPVVATRVPGCIDAVIDGETGTLVEPRDVGSLREGITSYLRDPALRTAHGQAGRRRVRVDFRQEAIWAALDREYRGLLRAAGVHLSSEFAEVDGQEIGPAR